jgi:hypothetical protein
MKPFRIFAAMSALLIALAAGCASTGETVPAVPAPTTATVTTAPVSLSGIPLYLSIAAGAVGLIGAGYYAFSSGSLAAKASGTSSEVGQVVAGVAAVANDPATQAAIQKEIAVLSPAAQAAINEVLPAIQAGANIANAVNGAITPLVAATASPVVVATAAPKAA